MMTSVQESLKEIEDLMNSKPVCCDEDGNFDDDFMKDLKILPTTAKWGCLVDVRLLASRIERAVKLCDHKLQLLVSNQDGLSVLCQFCNFEKLYIEGIDDVICDQVIEVDKTTLDDDTNSNKGVITSSNKISEKVGLPLDESMNSTEHLMDENDVHIRIEKDQVIEETSDEPVETIGKETDNNHTNENDATFDDDEIDKLLMDSPPQTENTKKPIIDESVTATSNPSSEELLPLDLLYPEVTVKELKDDGDAVLSQSPKKLKLKPLKDLQPLVPGLPQYTSKSVEDGVNPMENIPVYEEDDSLVEENLIDASSFNHIDASSLNHATVLGKSRITYRVVGRSEMDKSSTASGRPAFTTAQQLPSPHHPQQLPGNTRARNLYTTQPQQQDSRVRARMTNQFRAVSASRLMLPGGLVMNPVYPGQPRHQHQAQPQLSSDHTYYNTPSHAHASNQAGPNIMRHSRPELPLYHDPRLPPGWGRSIQRAPSGECFVVIHDSSGRTFRNREELRTYLVSSGVAGPDPVKVDFSVFGKVM